MTTPSKTSTADRPSVDADGRRWHDMGGAMELLGEQGAIDLDQHDFALWEKRVDALLVLASARGYFTVDGLRRVLEDMGPEAFERFSYYERWVQAVAQNLVEAGVVTLEELRAKTEEVAARGSTYGEASLAGTSTGEGA